MVTSIRLIVLSVLLMGLLPVSASSWERSRAATFATLPAGAAHPEGITADDAGRIYVTTFDVTKASGPGQLFVFGPQGHLLRQVGVVGSSQLLLDLAFHPTTGALLVIDFGNARVLTVDPKNGVSSVFAALPDLTPSDPSVGPGPNVLTFDRQGNVYISDSFQGVIWRIGPHGGAPVAWFSSPLLTTSGVPPFGANGLAFDKAGTSLFVANTGSDRVLKIGVKANGDADTAAIFANSVNGADGLILDEDDNIWVAANQANEIVVLDPTGRTIAKLGDFDGIGHDGAPNGLLFPASLVRKGPFIYVTNLALDLRLFSKDYVTGDSQWAAEVTRHTVARIRARLPRVPGLP